MLRLTFARSLTVAAFGLLSVSAYHLIPDDDKSTAYCCASNARPEVQAACLNASKEPNWYDWLTGESRSAQFHYLDLLELLSRGDNQQASSLSGKRY